MKTNPVTTFLSLPVFGSMAMLLFAAPGTAQGQSLGSQAFHACYMPQTGVVYLIKQVGLPTACRSDTHVEFTWGGREFVAPLPGTMPRVMPDSVGPPPNPGGPIVSSLNALTGDLVLSAQGGTTVVANGDTITIQSNSWNLGGNAGTAAGSDFLGTTDDQPFELHVNGARAFRLEPHATSPNVVGGFAGNSVAAGVSGAMVGGGGNSGFPNQVSGDFGTVAGGRQNEAAAAHATVAGGVGNMANGRRAAVAGGIANGASGDDAAIGGGNSNSATGDFAEQSVIVTVAAEQP